MSAAATSDCNPDASPALMAVRSSVLFSFVAFEQVSLTEANEMLMAWGHKMGALHRGNQDALCHALTHEGKPMAVTTASNLIAGVVGNCAWMNRKNTIELSRLCAARGGLCRVALRLWREFVFPTLGYDYAMSYQDAGIHTGTIYRFDGWERVGRSRSGPDTRSGRPGRDKYVWAWPPRQKPTDQADPQRAPSHSCPAPGSAISRDMWAVVFADGHIVTGSDLHTEADAWRIALGWPGPEEIADAMKRGAFAVKARLRYYSPNDKVSDER